MATWKYLALLTHVTMLFLTTRGDSLLATEPAPVVLRNFDAEPLGRLPSITHHTWSESNRKQADQFSQIEVVSNGKADGRCGQLTITKDFPWGRGPEYRVMTIGPDYFPPQADAVRMKVRAIAGRCVLTIGSPTVYFGHSDVLTEKIELDAAKSVEWQRVEVSLHHKLTRNQRRARFGRESPVIYYTRWIQEPLYLCVSQGSQGTVQFDEIELISRGEGQPYPTFPREQLQTVKTIADFESQDDIRQAFTFFQDPIDLARPPYLVRPDWEPARLSRVSTEPTGRHALLIEQRGTEETCFAGIKAPNAANADAISVTLRAENERGPQPLVIDFLVYAAPENHRNELLSARHQPPAIWKEQPKIAFDYYLSQHQTTGESYAFYHARRAFAHGEWTTLTLPLEDFICAYGQGEMADSFRQQKPLRSEDIIAIGLTPPYRHRRVVTKIWIDELSYVKLPANATHRTSFPQSKR